MKVPRASIAIIFAAAVSVGSLLISAAKSPRADIRSEQVPSWSDTAGSGNSNSGHDYGTKLSENEKHDLIEYLKTL